ncbi:MAG: tetratricopeptide repeat protein [Tannerellaceae bacterium]|jgi:Flp pilus assembly protein TadD|nr:tetratricopeptide repeat protein [Tannerellaceae bacterium]
MSKKYVLPLLVLAAIVTLSSCSNKLNPLAEEYVKAEPQPLEAIGGEVPVTIDATFPAKWFNKNAVVTITPVLRYQGGEAWGTAYTFQGEKVKGNNQVIPQKNGGNATLKSSFSYKPEMKKSELFLTFDAKIKNKTVQLPDLKIGEGVIATSELADAATATPAIGADKFQRIIKEAHNANIMFLIQQAELRSKELSKQEISDWKNLVKNASDAPNQNVAVEISAYASPDGGVKLNTGLAEKRESATSSYLDKELKKAKIDVPVDAHYTAQDWEGFQELVSKSAIQDKDLVLRVLSMYKDTEQREQEIKNISSVFSVLAEEILPQLRRSRLTANVEIIGKSDDEISALAKSNPGALNVEEILYAATLTNNAAEKEAIYTKATQQYPNDYRTWNNLGNVRFRAGDLAKAEELFNKANSVKANNESNLNLGLIALTKSDKSKAQQLFGSAASVNELSEALGVLYLKQGEYAKAVSSFGSIKSNNAALAQILTKDYSKAQQTLNAVPNADGATEYLKAIVAARTNDTNGVVNNLKAAIAKDRVYVKEAASDLEFAKYTTNADFAALIR